ncbi:MAG: amidohydrolase family protein, partial [Planctomycetota bacterium]
RDYDEAGSVNPNAVAAVSVNPDSELIPTTRANGVLLCNSHPSGGLVSGQGSVMQLDGWTYEEMTVLESAGVVMNWPRMLPIQAWWMEDSVEEQLKQRNEQLRGVEIFFAQANRYRLAKEAGNADYDAKLEAILPVLAGEKPLLMVANEQQQIQLAVAFAERHGLKMVLMGGRDAGKCADLLKAADVPVVLIGTQRSPGARDNGYDTAYKLPADLHEAGVKFAIASDRRSSFARNLPYHAGAAIAFGLPEDVALQAITSAPADILGVGDRVGTLEVGKDATLFVADGDIFETPTQVTAAWIAGAPVDLSSRHTMLNDKYKQRYGQE